MSEIQKIQGMIDGLTEIIPMLSSYEDQFTTQLDMSESRVLRSYDYTSEPCATIGCFAGHYLAASHASELIPPEEESYDDEFSYLSNRGEKTSMAYSEGALRFAQKLGFESIAGLVSWCGENPEIFGNENGHMLFQSEWAWTDAEDHFESDWDADHPETSVESMEFSDQIEFLDRFRRRLEACQKELEAANGG